MGQKSYPMEVPKPDVLATTEQREYLYEQKARQLDASADYYERLVTDLLAKADISKLQRCVELQHKIDALREVAESFRKPRRERLWADEQEKHYGRR